MIHHEHRTAPRQQPGGKVSRANADLQNGFFAANQLRRQIQHFIVVFMRIVPFGVHTVSFDLGMLDAVVIALGPAVKIPDVPPTAASLRVPSHGLGDGLDEAQGLTGI